MEEGKGDVAGGLNTRMLNLKLEEGRCEPKTACGL